VNDAKTVFGDYNVDIVFITGDRAIATKLYKYDNIQSQVITLFLRILKVPFIRQPNFQNKNFKFTPRFIPKINLSVDPKNNLLIIENHPPVGSHPLFNSLY
jgi:hypothetical protein